MLQEKKELTKAEALKTITDLSKMKVEDFKQALEQTPGYLEMVWLAFKKYLDSSDQSLEKINAYVKQLLNIIEKYLQNAEQPSEQLVSDILQMAKEVVMKAIDSIQTIEDNKGKVFWYCFGWTLLGVLAGAAGGLFLGNYGSKKDTDDNDKRA